VSIAKYVKLIANSLKLIASKRLRPIAYGLMLILVSMFSLSDAWAQSAETRTAEGQEKALKFNSPSFHYDYDKYPPEKGYKIEDEMIVKIKVGDKIPERLWRLPLWVVHRSDINDTITLEKYRDRSLFVIDFWSVWCAPCIQSMQKWEEMLTQIDSSKIAFLGALVFDQP